MMTITSRQVDDTSLPFHQRKVNGHVGHTDVDSLFRGVPADCALHTVGRRDYKPSLIVAMPLKDVRIEVHQGCVVRSGEFDENNRVCHVVTRGCSGSIRSVVI